MLQVLKTVSSPTSMQLGMQKSAEKKEQDHTDQGMDPKDEIIAELQDKLRFANETIATLVDQQEELSKRERESSQFSEPQMVVDNMTAEQDESLISGDSKAKDYLKGHFNEDNSSIDD
jgi:hypothetical protein